MKKLTLFFLLLGTSVFAHAGAMGIVKERMDGMKAIGASLKSIAPMMTGKAEFDAGIAGQASQVIIEHSGQNMIDRFPEGSEGGVSEAATAIWEQPEAFAEIAFELEKLAAEIPDANLSAEARLQLFQDIGQTCKDCHSDYRIEN